MASRHCGNCGAPVGRGEVSCPACGASFAAVRCGRCGYRGGEDEFVDDRCPACRERVDARRARWPLVALAAGGAVLLLALLFGWP